jgi:LacI family transcriptional regulator, galactose operon repressor
LHKEAGMRRSVSVKDVAARAGVSLGTVSNVLNRPDRVSERTRRRVHQAMTELGFVRNESARALRAGTSNAVAYLMLDAANPFLHDVAHGIDDVVESEDLSRRPVLAEGAGGRRRHRGRRRGARCPGRRE